MHIRNGDAPYKNTLDAMSYWPEKETAVGACLNDDGSISIISAFGIESLFSGKVSYNNKRSQAVFMERVISKKWLETWPQLQIVLVSRVRAGCMRSFLYLKNLKNLLA